MKIFVIPNELNISYSESNMSLSSMYESVLFYSGSVIYNRFMWDSLRSISRDHISYAEFRDKHFLYHYVFESPQEIILALCHLYACFYCHEFNEYRLIHDIVQTKPFSTKISEETYHLVLYYFTYSCFIGVIQLCCQCRYL